MTAFRGRSGDRRGTERRALGLRTLTRRVTFEGTEVLVFGEENTGNTDRVTSRLDKTKKTLRPSANTKQENEEENDTGRRACGLLGRPRRPVDAGGTGPQHLPSRTGSGGDGAASAAKREGD
ncbi:hypothetical protein THAOC_06942, partial [Thalassiosira oceanica]